MSRPRQSLLSLFDPLSASQDPSTPPRNDSPSAESDKENENPPRTDLTMSTFFNRTYKPNHQDTIRPLRRRLIDVGDITVDHSDGWDDLNDDEPDSHVPDLTDVEDNENDTLTFRHIAEAATPKWNTTKHSTVKTPSPSTSRTPLSELSFDLEATPMARSKPNRKLPQSASRSKLCEVESPQFQLIVSDASPRRATFEERVPGLDAITSGILDDKENLGASTGFGIAIPNPLVNSVSSINLPSSSVCGSVLRDTTFSPTASISDDPLSSNGSFTRSHLRPNPPSTSSLDQSRSSVDLQSSFQLYLNDESNFDLLNDKVSFLGMSKIGSKSFLDEDTSFDMSFGDATPPPFEKLQSSPPQVFPRETKTLSPEPRKALFVEVKKAAVEPREISLPDSPVARDETPEPFLSKASSRRREEPKPVDAITPKHARAVPAPPPVVGLRIVKRSQAATQAAEKSEPVKAVPSPRLVPRQSLMSLSRSPSQPNRSKADIPPAPGRKSTLQSVSSLLSRARSNAAEATKPSVTRSTSYSASNSTSSSGPRRVLVTADEPERRLTRATPSTLGRASGASLQGGPRRVTVSDRPSIAQGSMSANSDSLKQASAATGIPKSQSTRTKIGSSLPQPTSRSTRLPAPSGTVRSSALPAPARDSTIRGFASRRVI